MVITSFFQMLIGANELRNRIFSIVFDSDLANRPVRKVDLSNQFKYSCSNSLGRRKLMLFAVAGQCACMAILAGTVSTGTKSGGVVAIVMLFLFNFFFAVGLLAVPWLRKFLYIPAFVLCLTKSQVPAEYAPLAIRTRAASLATASNCKISQYLGLL